MQTFTRAAAAAALLLAPVAARAGQSSWMGVNATVVRSLRLQVSQRSAGLSSAASASAAAPKATVRTVAAAGGTYYVVGFDIGANDAGAPSDFALQVRSDGSQGQADIRYHQGRDGSWGSRGFGQAVPAASQGSLQVALQPSAHAQGGEVALFVAKDAPAREVDVVVTVMADAVSAQPQPTALAAR